MCVDYAAQAIYSLGRVLATLSDILASLSGHVLAAKPSYGTEMQRQQGKVGNQSWQRQQGKVGTSPRGPEARKTFWSETDD